MASSNLLPEEVSYYRKIHEGGRLGAEYAKCRAPLLREPAGSYKAQIFGLFLLNILSRLFKESLGRICEVQGAPTKRAGWVGRAVETQLRDATH